MAEWYEQLLELQLRANRDIWAGLQEHGRGAPTVLRLGFAYLSPGEDEARRLVAFLQRETDYEVEVRSRRQEDDPDAEPTCFVTGTTQPTAASLELLDNWVEWMIAAGAVEGPCAFDGWAAQLVGD